MRAAEKGWWLGFGIWLLVFVFWRPEPPPIYNQVPSVKKDPDGFRIFYEMVSRQAASVSRTLRSPRHLKEKDVLVLLHPREGLDERDRQDLVEWVSQSGGTLVVGYPIWDSEGTLLESPFSKDSYWTSSDWVESEAKLCTVSYAPAALASPRKVAPFTMKLRGQLSPEADSSKTLAHADDGRVMATLDTYGSGKVIQLADAAMINNEALGFKKSHLFAAALLDEIGRKGRWVFDESNEGISIQPALAPLLGASSFRAVFLYVLLFFLFWYWYRTRRLLRIRKPENERDVREVTTLAVDIGRFYFGAKKSSWALSRYLAFFKRRLHLANLAPAVRERAKISADDAQRVLDTGDSAERQLQMIRNMAEHREVIRDKNRDEE